MQDAAKSPFGSTQCDKVKHNELSKILCLTSTRKCHADRIRNYNTPMKQLHVYMLRCSDQSIYVGVTNNIPRRFNEHQTVPIAIGINETAYTYSRRPVQLIFVRWFNDFLQAIAFEKQLKKWTRKKEEALAMNDIQLLKELAAS